jgi:hypothetical protein
MCRGSADVRTDGKRGVMALLCEECLGKVRRKLRPGRSLFDHEQGNFGFCERCYNLIDAFLDERVKRAATDKQPKDAGSVAEASP